MTTKSGNLSLGSLEKWDIATTKKFLKLYRNYRSLWDHTDPAYKDKSERQHALKSIAESMNIPGFDSRYVVLKVRALRSTYLYERRKVRLRLKNGEKFQTHLGWFHLADSFLRNYVVEKSYLHGNSFKDENKDLPTPAVDDNNYKQEDNTESNNNNSNISVGDGGFPKAENSVYDFYDDQDDPKSQITQYGDEDEDNDHEFHLHVLEVQQKPMQQQQIQSPPAPHNIQEVQIKNSVPIKQTRAQARKLDQQQQQLKKSDQQQVPLKQRNKIEQDSLPPPVTTSSVTNVIIDEKMYSAEEHLQQTQIQQQQLQQQQSAMATNQQISYMIPISQPGTPAPVLPSQLSTTIPIQSNSNMDQGPGNSTILSQIEMINQGSSTVTGANKSGISGGNNISIHGHNDNDEDEFDAFAKSVAMQLRKIPKADAYSLQVQFQLLLSQAKLKAMGKSGTISLDLSSFLGKG